MLTNSGAALCHNITLPPTGLVRGCVVCCPAPEVFSYTFRTARSLHFFVKLHTVEKAVVNDLLCFVSRARNFFTADNILPKVAGFYKNEDTEKA